MDNEAPAEQEKCAECGTWLSEGQDRQTTEDAVFCRPCFERLTHEVGQAIEAQGQDINYPMAFVGGLTGATLGAVVWWGFTVITNIAFGLVAVVIGFAVGKGVVLLSGGKRHRNLQIMSVAISILGFAYGTYLVNRSFITDAMAADGQEVLLPLLPGGDLLFNVISMGFRPFDLVFLGICVYQAWKMPAPVELA
ncbi:MAG: hypothetical protein OES25_06725 [Acidobacteriota bacterium]|nr:hypothetical protein [Acidobacteriota bacterium]